MKILIVDDEYVSRKKAQKIMDSLGECEVVENGEDALKIAMSENPPDLILLDIMMPGIDGYEVCSRLKADKRSSNIPIIFVSAEDEQEDEAKGLGLGAVDYITKPFSPAIVKARVRTHLELEKHREHLEGLVKERTAELVIANEKLKREMQERKRAEEEARLHQERLIHADKMASIGQLAAGVAHEINNPTSFVSVNASTMETWWKLFEPVFDKAIESGWDQELGLEKLSEMLAKFPGMIQSIKGGAARIASITSALRDFSRSDNDKKQLVDIRQVLESAAIMTKNHYKYHADLVIENESEIPKIFGNDQKLEQVFVNLIINASDAIKEKVDIMKEGNRSFKGLISIITSLRQTMEKGIEIVVKDNGIGMEPDVMRKVFDPFFTTKSKKKGTGLGMWIVYGITQDHGGSISVQSAKGEETTFTITLPLG